jgi:hypothetical protein
MVLFVRKSNFCWFALLIGMLSHNSALPILGGMAVLIWLLNRNRRFAFNFLTALILWGILTSGTYWFLDNELRLSPSAAVNHASSKFMSEVPEAIDTFSEKYPDSTIAANKEALKRYENNDGMKLQLNPLLWNKQSPYKFAREEMAKEGNLFILHSLRYHFYENIRIIITNPFRLLFQKIHRKRVRTALWGLDDRLISLTEKYYPHLSTQMKSGLQYQGKKAMGRAFYERAAIFLFYTSCIICSLIPLTWIFRGKVSSPLIWFWAPIGALSYVVIHVCVTATFGGIGAERQHIKLFYVPTLVSILFLAYFTRDFLTRAGILSWMKGRISIGKK